MDLILLVASGIIAMALGDTIFIRSLSFIYVSNFSQCVFFTLTVAIAILFLSETFTCQRRGGGLILGGLYLVTGFENPNLINVSPGCDCMDNSRSLT